MKGEGDAAQPRLPDPRRYGSGDHAFLSLSDAGLRVELRRTLADSRSGAIAAALAAAPTHKAYAKLWNAACDAAHRVGNDAAADTIVARIFALPLVVVTGSARPARISGVIPDSAAVRALFENHGALGKSRNFGIGNALCSLETLQQVTPFEIFEWSAAAAVPRELPPSPIAIDAPGEFVHLRFVAGAALAPAAEPSFVETGSNIGAWGMPLTRLLASQLAQPGVELLPLPRPPLDLLRAAHAGRAAQLEAAFSLFMSNAVRRFRGSSGDPFAEISAHEDGEIRVRLGSAFDDAAAETFRWPLDRLDDIGGIAAAASQLLKECRVNDVRWRAEILPAPTASAPCESGRTDSRR